MKDGRMLGRTVVGKAQCDTEDLVEALLAAARATGPNRRVLSITGPPHSGKSRALDEFVRRCGEDAFSLPLTDEDTTLFAFVFALVQSMGPIARGAQLSFNAMRSRLSTPNCIPQLVSWLHSHLQADAWIAVDNIELLEPGSPVVQLLLAMVQRCPRVRWIFAGRTLDALPLQTLIAQRIAGDPFTTETLESFSTPSLLARLDESERGLLAAVAPLRTLDPPLVGAILGEEGMALVRRLYERVPALFEVNGTVRLHRDVRNALLEELSAMGDDIVQSTVGQCGVGLEAFECYEELLRMYLRNRAHAQLEDVIGRRGLFLADHVNADTLESALYVVSTDSPGVRSLQAILASRRAQYDLADALFESVASSASQPLAAQIQYAYGCDLLRRNRPDCAPIFEKLLDEYVPGSAHQSEIRSALAQAYVLCDLPAAALEEIKFALHVLPGAPDEAVVKSRAAYVYFYAARDLMLAERIASDALAQALRTRAYTVAVGAASLLYNIACERDRPNEAIAALNLLADCGIKLGNIAFQSYAIIAMLEYYVEAGDTGKIAHAMETLRAFEIAPESLAASESLAVAEAMQRSWRGDFAGAYDLLEPTAWQPVGQDYRALREAQLAFFACGADRLVASREHVRRALALLQTVDGGTHKALRARTMLGIALSVGGDPKGAQEQFDRCAEVALQFARLASVRDGAILVHQSLQGDENVVALREAFMRMQERGAGGFAMMLNALPRSPAPRWSAIVERPLRLRPA